MLINIQFLRFAAAMLVVVYHVSSHVRDAGAELGRFFSLAEAIGFAGVDIFFVISGFIMAHTTAEVGGLADGWSFARRRVARIYSGYWPFFVLALLLFWWMNPAYLERASLLRSAILWPANALLIAVSWTLVFEMFFYVLFTALIVTSRHRARYFLVVLTVLLIAFAVYSQFVRRAYDPGQLETMSLAEYYMLSPYLAEFLAGAILANGLRRRPHGLSWSLLTAGVLLFLAGGWLNTAGFQGQIEQGYFVFYRVAVFGAASVLIVAGLVRLENQGRHTPRTVSLLAGGASYAIYLSHTLLLAATQHVGLNRWLSSHGTGFVQTAFLLYAALVLLHGIAHYRWVERPLHRRFRRWLRI
jgi:peptidoglycan/LPS O-acetylase OafA/YrhL